MTCAGCASVPIPTPNVSISDACEKLPGQKPLPTLAEKTNAKAQLAEHRAGMKTLNGRIDAKDQCYRNQRSRLANG